MDDVKFFDCISILNKMRASFPISQPMIGSVIPGAKIEVGRTRLANYNDFSTHPAITRRKKIVDPVVQFPDMNNPHGAGHSVIEKLKQLMAGGGKQHPHGPGSMGLMPPKIQMQEGYQPVRENLDWRRM